jgi:uncharacterized SAM-binding protein YcdF (DUF218 family)
MRLLLRALFAGALFLAGAAASLTLIGAQPYLEHADALVVLGNTVRHGKPSARLAARLQEGERLWRAGYAPVIIVSGGIERDGEDEGLVMRAALLAHGVPDSVIVADSQGRDTWETARFTSRWLAAHHARSVIAVSQYFHLVRCQIALRRFGVPIVYRSGPRYFEWRDLYSAPREVIGLLQYTTRRSPRAGG